MREARNFPLRSGTDGVSAQPGVAARMISQLRLTEAGVAAALVAAVCSVLAVIGFPSFSASEASGLAWAVVALVGSGTLLVICVIQVVVWRRAMASWRGRRPQDLHGAARLSWIAHLASYPAVLLTLFGSIGGIAYASWATLAAVLLGVSLISALPAQVLAGVQYLRTDGPPGTLPAHVRRLIERSSQREDDRLS